VDKNALYYPEIDFADVGMIKAMSLFYDRVYRIVPHDVAPKDAPELAALIESGIGTPIDPSAYSPAASTKFLNKLDRWDASALGDNGTGKKLLARLHSEKVDDRIRRLFSDLGYSESEDWFDVPAEFVSNYMIFLAKEIATTNKLSLSTRRWEAWTAATYFNLDGAVDEFCFSDFDGHSAESHPFALFNLIIGQLTPINIAEIPAEKILEFRSRRKDEIACFRNALFDLSDELSGVQEREIRKDLILDKFSALNRAQEQYQKSADFLRVRGWQGFSTVAFPAATALLAYLNLHPALATSLCGAHLALGAAFHIRNSRQDIARIKRESPASFITDVRRDFRHYTGQRGGGDVNFHAYNCMEEYVND